MIRSVFVFVLIFCSLGAPVRTQQPSGGADPCATMERHKQLLSDPRVSKRRAEIEAQTQQLATGGTEGAVGAVITIPVVVHVVHNTASQNIPASQVASQIAVLNEDFRRTNPDAANTLPVFQGVAADSRIEFCLATVDPLGNPHGGITRTQTATPSFSPNDRVKATITGGRDPWPTSDYLNIWVCNLGTGLIGYAQFPGGPASTDGVVIDYRHFGRGGYFLIPPLNLGRTATHEVGHWLNLNHVWGTAGCGSDDLVGDTPSAYGPNVGCALGHTSCGTLDMVQNYMDYTDDACKNLFTQGQVDRMRALFAPGGARESLLFSQGCGPGAPMWQENVSLSSVHLDGVTTDGFSPAISTKCPGESGMFAMSSSDPTGLFNLALIAAPLVPGNSPVAFQTPSGQFFHIDLADPNVLFWNASPATLIPYPGNQCIPYFAPAIGSYSMQMLKVHPSHPDGYCLSAGAQLEVAAVSAPPVSHALTLGDDDTVAIHLASPVSFYGSSTTTIHVNSNGSVSLMNGDTSFAANASAFISGPPRVAGHWSDLAPHVGGTVEWTQSCGDTVVRFTGVPEVGAPSETTTFHVSFLSGGSVTIDNAMVTPGWTTDSLVGFTPGAAVGGRVVNFSGLVGSTFAPPVGHAVFEHVPGGAPSPFGSITLTASGDLVVN